MTRDTDLLVRQGLPEALRVLLEAYPRSGWTTDPGFDGLIRFWLERHMGFRDILARLRVEAEAQVDRRSDAARTASAVSRFGGALISQLHGHHQIEDAHYFPVLAGRDTRVAGGFEILDRDHAALDGLMAEFVTKANRVLHVAGDGALFRDRTGAFLEEIGRFGGFLDRHLVDEEELIVPVILKYGMDGLH
jgi:iron-sulfur cluster repair protein YtfE (RIC family)